MTTTAIAKKYAELANQSKWEQILDELCAPELVNKEPEHVASRGLQPITSGVDNIKAKGNKNREMIEAMHSQFCSEPLVAGNFFTVALSRDVTFKGMPRGIKEELALFEVKDGKIISEQFFY